MAAHNFTRKPDQIIHELITAVRPVTLRRTQPVSESEHQLFRVFSNVSAFERFAGAIGGRNVAEHLINACANCKDLLACLVAQSPAASRSQVTTGYRAARNEFIALATKRPDLAIAIHAAARISKVSR